VHTLIDNIFTAATNRTSIHVKTSSTPPLTGLFNDTSVETGLLLSLKPVASHFWNNVACIRKLLWS